MGSSTRTCYHGRVNDPTSTLSPRGPLDVAFTALSAVVPGLGQLVTGRFVDAALFLLATVWFHGFFAGLADADRLGAALFLGFGLPSGFARPVVVVFTTLGVALHVFAAWAMWNRHSPAVRSHPSE